MQKGGPSVSRQRRICIIHNPIAGYGRSRKIRPRVERALREKGLEFEILTTQARGHAEQLSRTIDESRFDAVVAMGGDGTLGEVVNGVMAGGSCRLRVGIIPSGTGNDFAGGNRLFFSWEEAVQALADPGECGMDVFRFEDSAGFSRYVINSIGFGFDAYVARRVTELGSRKIGRLSYMLEALRGLVKFAPETVKVQIDGSVRTYEDLWMFAITNSEKFGGGMKVCPGARSHDGMLDCCFLHGVSRFDLLQLVFLVWFGKHIGRPGVVHSRANRIVVDAPPDFPCHLDGDTVRVKYPVTVQVIPGVLPFIVPTSYIRGSGRN